MAATVIGESDVDLFDEGVMDNPYLVFKELRDAGGVVWLSRYGIYALPRYETAKGALADDKTFISGVNKHSTGTPYRRARGTPFAVGGRLSR